MWRRALAQVAGGSGLMANSVTPSSPGFFPLFDAPCISPPKPQVCFLNGALVNDSVGPEDNLLHQQLVRRRPIPRSLATDGGNERDELFLIEILT